MGSDTASMFSDGTSIAGKNEMTVVLTNVIEVKTKVNAQWY